MQLKPFAPGQTGAISAGKGHLQYCLAKISLNKGFNILGHLKQTIFDICTPLYDCMSGGRILI
ncbi:MAG: hypothetical protein MR862_03110 [Clostridia bacterium]|nr:hypothetical protein [Clostridia bacterium]